MRYLMMNVRMKNFPSPSVSEIRLTRLSEAQLERFLSADKKSKSKRKDKNGTTKPGGIQSFLTTASSKKEVTLWSSFIFIVTLQ